MSDDIHPRNMTEDSIGRALDRHVTAGLIRGWERTPVGWRVNLVSMGSFAYAYVEAKSKREIGILLAGLVSAEYGNAQRPGVRSDGSPGE